MASKQLKELLNLSKAELLNQERDLRTSLFQAKMKHATGQLENTASVWQMRKKLARVLTLQGKVKG